MSSSAR